MNLSTNWLVNVALFYDIKNTDKYQMLNLGKRVVRLGNSQLFYNIHFNVKDK